MTPQERYKKTLTEAPAGDYIIETIELSHSLFSQSYFLTREPEGINAILETSESVFFQGTNIQIVLSSKKADLDANFSFTLQDPDNILDDELERIPLNNEEKILLKYRTFNDKDLTSPAFFFYLSVFEVNQQKGGFTMISGASQLNYNKTGEVYTFERFPMLRAL